MAHSKVAGKAGEITHCWKLGRCRKNLKAFFVNFITPLLRCFQTKWVQQDDLKQQVTGACASVTSPLGIDDVQWQLQLATQYTSNYKGLIGEKCMDIHWVVPSD